MAPCLRVRITPDALALSLRRHAPAHAGNVKGDAARVSFFAPWSRLARRPTSPWGAEFVGDLIHEKRAGINSPRSSAEMNLGNTPQILDDAILSLMPFG